MTCPLCLPALWLCGTICDKHYIFTLQCICLSGSACMCVCVCVWLVDCQMRFQELPQCKTIQADCIRKVHVLEAEALPMQCMCWLSLHFIVFTFHSVRLGRGPLFYAMENAWEYIDVPSRLQTWHCMLRESAFVFSPIEKSLWAFWEILLFFIRQLPIHRGGGTVLHCLCTEPKSCSLRLSFALQIDRGYLSGRNAALF